MDKIARAIQQCAHAVVVPVAAMLRASNNLVQCPPAWWFWLLLLHTVVLAPCIAVGIVYWNDPCLSKHVSAPLYLTPPQCVTIIALDGIVIIPATATRAISGYLGLLVHWTILDLVSSFSLAGFTINMAVVLNENYEAGACVATISYFYAQMFLILITAMQWIGFIASLFEILTFDSLRRRYRTGYVEFIRGALMAVHRRERIERLRDELMLLEQPDVEQHEPLTASTAGPSSSLATQLV